MPKRKKHRKHGRNKQKTRQEPEKQPNTLPVNTEINKIDGVYGDLVLDQNTSNTLVSSNADCCTPVRTKVPNRKDSFELETPVKTMPSKDKCVTPQHNVSKSNLFDNFTPVKTPINKRRSLNRQNDAKLNGKLNATNLNALFDSNIGALCGDGFLVDNSEDKRRTGSCIPKLHSPGKEKPLSFHKSTQTMDEMELEKDLHDLITETPRVSHKIVSAIETNEHLPPQLNNMKHLSHQISKLNADDFNINPYIREKEFVRLDLNAQKSSWRKEGGVEELSFFSPQLFDARTSSTPISRMQGPKVFSYLKENVVRENLESVVRSEGKRGFINNKIDETPLREVMNRTPRSEKLNDQINNSFDLTVIDSATKARSNVNVNTPPLTEKVLNKDKSNSIKLLGSNKRRNGGASTSRLHNRTSPKISRLVNHSRLLNKNLSYSRLNASRRSLMENSFELAGTSSIPVGMYERLINKIKRYSRASARWSVKMMEACAQLGIQIKNSLTSLCNVYGENSILETCRCKEYKAEVSNLNGKIEALNAEVVTVRRQIEEYHNSEKSKQGSIENLHEELVKVKQELSNFTDLRSELTSLKEQFECFKETPTAISIPPPPPPLCGVPPPPPPPLPPVFTQCAPIKLGKRSKSSLGLIAGADKLDSRPVISLDEILKVKLKKASDRPTTTPAARPRSSTPLVPQDLFRQVKLRPQLRTSLPRSMPCRANFSTPASASSTSSETSTSPHSSLCRILNGEPVWKVKRLRKVGGYSLDSVHRKLSPVKQSAPFGAGKRDRLGS